jgi:hypothetical protein
MSAGLEQQQVQLLQLQRWLMLGACWVLVLQGLAALAQCCLQERPNLPG